MLDSPYALIVYTFKPLRTCVFLSIPLLLQSALLLPTSAAAATDHFEIYCDGVGIFLTKIDGAPAPGKFVLFSYMSFPPGTNGGRYLGQGKWSDVAVYRDWCLPDDNCVEVARGKVWIDAWDTPETSRTSPKRISGKYEIDLDGKHLEGRFVAKQHPKHPERFCM